ncbi:hypothetical protein PBI_MICHELLEMYBELL_1 [Mycobacterium phage MichelleMyBell]|uniref:Terminase small subunit n=1 Tax=Mycobacterium phage MichelleMyBell TaxID=1445726 RepID=W0LJX5_9CAUD|nr:hypothetical protein CH20_gp01 [Mycobacterium phage MichelleMyBell]AHG24322.1 hypothetical protein PBI_MICHELLEMYBELL_1 [Mycobacterium phage MichelleMyBell]
MHVIPANFGGPMRRECAVCGQPFEAQRPQAKYCGETCRKRAQRGGIAKQKQQQTAPAPAASAAPSGGGLIETVQAALEQADRLNTIAGQHALELARRIVYAPGMNTGVAALSKQLQAVLAEALAGTAPVAADPVDELKARRDAKRRKGA